MKYSKIAGTGSYLPQKILTNFDLEKMVDTTHDWIVSRTGIKQRHVAADHETASSLAYEASLPALEAAGIKAKDLGLIIVSTTTPQMVFPSTAGLLQEKLNIGGCAAFDLNASACAGFLYAMSIADQYIKTGAVKHALIVGSEVMSRVIDWNDRSTCVLFGDGAGAIVLSASTKPGILSTHIHANGNYKDVLYLPLGTFQSPNIERVQMQGNALFKLAVNTLGDIFDETLEKNKLKKTDIDWLIPHQANIRIINAMAKKLNLTSEQVVITLPDQGNTSSASIPIALDTAIRDGRVKRGQVLMMEAFGGGLAWGSAVVKY